MTTWTTLFARVLLVVTLASPLVQAHTDHLSGSLATGGLWSIVLDSNDQSHHDSVPHEDTTEHGEPDCSSHPSQVQAIDACQGSSQGQQQETLVFSYFLHALRPVPVTETQLLVSQRVPKPHIPDRVPTALVLRV